MSAVKGLSVQISVGRFLVCSQKFIAHVHLLKAPISPVGKEISLFIVF